MQTRWNNLEQSWNDFGRTLETPGKHTLDKPWKKQTGQNMEKHIETHWRNTKTPCNTLDKSWKHFDKPLETR